MEKFFAVPRTRHTGHDVRGCCGILFPHPARPNAGRANAIRFREENGCRSGKRLGSDKPSIDIGHGGVQCCTYLLIFLILKRKNSFSPYLQVVISPKNYFLFTPLLPSVAVGTLNPRSIIQPTRYITRHKSRNVSVIEAEATDVDVSVERPLVDDVDADPLLPCSQRTRQSLSPVRFCPSNILGTAMTQLNGHLSNQGRHEFDFHQV